MNFEPVMGRQGMTFSITLKTITTLARNEVTKVKLKRDRRQRSGGEDERNEPRCHSRFFYGDWLWKLRFAKETKIRLKNATARSSPDTP